ncbi:MAG: phosphatase PAP2 family protein [Phycisphaerales bacterium]|nr:phosphatase PAP2 family protein [Phycisphaerales bacterium]
MKLRDKPAPLTLRLAWTCGLALAFLVIYAGTNWYTSTRVDVGILRFEWEQRLPFIQPFIVPYMSIDALFLLAPFLCRTRRELKIHGVRILAITAIAGVCFLLLPLQLADVRPDLTGVTGWSFELLKSFDRPFNMCPSLHVAYAIVLWELYRRRAGGWLLAVVNIWFVLIVVSVLFVRQHYLVDALAGASLAIGTLYAAPAADDDDALPGAGEVRPNRKVAAWCAAGAVGMFAAAALLSPAGLVLVWPGVSMAVVGAGYAGVGPRIFRKVRGRLRPEARVVLAPYLAGLWVTRVIFSARESHRSGTALAPGLVIGGRCSNRAAEALIGRRITAVLDLTAEHSAPPAFQRVEYFNIQILDLTLPTQEQLRQAVAIGRRFAADGTLYIHCGLGYARSATVAAAILLDRDLAVTAQESIDLIAASRPNVEFNEQAQRLLDVTARSLARSQRLDAALAIR